MSKKILALFIIALLIPGFLFAGITGKIKGKVIDRETGDNLPGANVIIKNTSMGAASDMNGQYVIMNVPAGVYTLRADFIGYQTVEIANIKVLSDLTTEVEFNLPSEALTGETVTIIAEKPLVNKNATNAMRSQGYEEFKNIPIRNAMAIVALQPGVVVQDNNMYIRGGRRDEVGYYLEGATTRDVFDGSNAITVIPEALQEFQLQAGGYTAEYGSANAGIIRQTLRSGTPDYHFTLQAETDNFADPGKKFLDTYSYGYSDYTITASGPVPGTDNKLKFFFAGQNIFERDRIVRRWNGFDFNHVDDANLEDENNFVMSTTNFGDIFEEGIHMKDGNIPWASRNNWLGSGTLVYDMSPFSIRLGFNSSYRTQTQVNDFSNFEKIFNSERMEQREYSENLVNLKVTHVVNPTTFYEVNFNYFDYRRLFSDPVMGNNFPAYYDSIANAEQGITFEEWETGNVYNRVDIYGFNFERPGNPSDFDKTHRKYWGGSFNFTSQLKEHELRFGGDFQRWTIRRYFVDEQSFFSNILTNPDIYRDARAGSLEDIGQFRTGANIGNYGYDAWGNEIDEDQLGTDGPKHPKYMSAYIQDKYEANQLVINAGVRLDVIDNDDFTFEDPMNPAWDRSTFSLDKDAIKKEDAFIYASPRLGLAFPATDRTVFHVQYGKFVQAPRLTDIYASDRWYNDLFTGGNYFIEPSGFGLRPQKTTSYEIGFNHQFADNASFDITVFYKDIQDWITTGKRTGEATDLVTSYNVLMNGDFATTKGLEFSMTLRRTNRVAAQVNYTYSSALGTGSNPYVNIASSEGNEPQPTSVMPMDFHRPHVGSINFDYRFAPGDGGPIFEQLGLNMLLNFSSGHPYTLRSGVFGQQDERYGGMINDERYREPLEAVNTSMTPWTYTINLRLDKRVEFGAFAAVFYAYVQNLTDRKNVANVFMRTGNPYDDGFHALTQTSGPIAAAHGGYRYWAIYDAVNLNENGYNYTEAGTRQSTFGNRLLFGPPRQIRFGLRLEL